MIVKSSKIVEIRRGHEHQELEEGEGSREGGGLDHMVAGKCAGDAAERGPLARRRGCREGGGRGSGPDGPRAHHECDGVVGGAGGGTAATGWCPACRGRDGGETVGAGESGPSATIPCTGRGSTARRSRWMRWLAPGWPESTGRCGGRRCMRSPARVRARGEEQRAGEKGGEGGTAAGGLLYHTAGERGARGRRAGGRHGSTTALAPCRACCGDSDGNFPKTPLDPFFLFAKRSSSILVNLIEALKHFYKMCKNSYGLQMTFRCSTKIGNAK